MAFNVKNTGSREGAEVAEAYVGDSQASLPRPVKELKGFAKVQLKPGETKHVTINLDQRAFSYYDVSAGGWKAEQVILRFWWAVLRSRLHCVENLH